MYLAVYLKRSRSMLTIRLTQQKVRHSCHVPQSYRSKTRIPPIPQRHAQPTDTQHLITAHHGRLPDPSYLVRAFPFSITSASDSILSLAGDMHPRRWSTSSRRPYVHLCWPGRMPRGTPALNNPTVVISDEVRNVEEAMAQPCYRRKGMVALFRPPGLTTLSFLFLNRSGTRSSHQRHGHRTDEGQSGAG
jgi:hypothetical protein